MSFDARHLFSILLITRCSSLDGLGTTGGLGETFNYNCTNPQTSNGPIEDFACIGMANGGWVPLPTAVAAGAHFYITYSGGSGGNAVEVAAPNVLLVMGNSPTNGSWPRITATRPGSATVFATCTSYSPGYCANGMMTGRVEGLAHIRIRRAVSLDVTGTSPFIDAGTRDAGQIVLRGFGGNFLVFPRDVDGNPLAGALDCTWTSSNATIVSVTGTGSTSGASLAAKARGTATIRVICGALSTTFDVSVDPFPDAGIDAASDAPSDGALDGDAPNDGGPDG